MNHCGAEAMRDRAPKHRELWLNLLLACASLLVFFLVCELIVFRFVLPATDMPENAFAEGVIRYAPEQRGVVSDRRRDRGALPHQRGWVEQRHS